MYRLPYAIPILLAIGGVLLFFEPWKHRDLILLRSVSVTAFVLAALCILGLTVAKPITCRVLGGTWLSNHSCVNEWGGNGHNFPRNLVP